jgi:hypothetical protein
MSLKSATLEVLISVLMRIQVYWYVTACLLVNSNRHVLAVPWLRRLAAGLPPRRPGFDPGSVHVGFMVDRLALGQVFPRGLRFSHVSFIN